MAVVLSGKMPVLREQTVFTQVLSTSGFFLFVPFVSFVSFVFCRSGRLDSPHSVQHYRIVIPFALAYDDGF